MFQPVVVGTGLGAWRFLERTLPQQREAFEASSQLQRDTEYFAQNIGSVRTAEDLMNDRRLLSVALGAYDLGDDINNRYFIQKILEGGVLEPDSLANKLSDDRYKEFSKAFGFGDFPTPNTVLSDFPAKIIDRFQQVSFERAVGEQDESLRLVMNLERQLPEIGARDRENDTLWFTIMGNPPLRKVFEGALGLPTSFGQIEIDKQLEIFKDRASARFDTDQISELMSADRIEEITRSFLLQTQIQNVQIAGSASIALSLLQAIPQPG